MTIESTLCKIIYLFIALYNVDATIVKANAASSNFNTYSARIRTVEKQVETNPHFLTESSGDVVGKNEESDQLLRHLEELGANDVQYKEGCDLKTKSFFSCLAFPLGLSAKYNDIQGNINNLGTFSTKPSHIIYPRKTNTQLISKKLSAYAGRFNDPSWNKQWYLQDYRTSDGPVMDHNVIPVYDLKITGKGVHVAVVDNGVVGDHADLKKNYDKSLSYDYCHNSPRSSPSGIRFFSKYHGTKCAGIIAMEANNKRCGVGIAFDAKISGVRSTCTGQSTLSEANALNHNLQHKDFVDIYSCSWGPKDDGKNMEKMGEMLDKALNNGVKQGRNGKGAIYIFPSGNGREVKYSDNCAADSHVNHMAVMAISSANYGGKPTEYSERCTAVLATTYSGDFWKGRFQGIVATGGGGFCTSHFEGTSASVPIASGIIALVLQANPDLTYRDIVHLIAMSAEVAPLARTYSWYKNNAGFWVSNDFGFGLMNAENMVLMAKSWKTLPVKRTCKVNLSVSPGSSEYLSTGVTSEFFVETDACKGSINEINFLEEVELISTISCFRRGDVRIDMTSARDTKSNMLQMRRNDYSAEGLLLWSFKTFHNWGENPRGKWIVTVNTQGRKVPVTADVRSVFSLKFHGTKDMPVHLESERTYATFNEPSK